VIETEISNVKTLAQTAQKDTVRTEGEREVTAEGLTQMTEGTTLAEMTVVVDVAEVVEIPEVLQATADVETQETKKEIIKTQRKSFQKLVKSTEVLSRMYLSMEPL
jgi:hypothetical protein